MRLLINKPIAMAGKSSSRGNTFPNNRRREIQISLKVQTASAFLEADDSNVKNAL
jgi:hypothetical protein